MKYDITPVAKPRMTHQGRKSPRLDRYWAFKNLIALSKIKIDPGNCNVIFGVPMPKSWTKKKKMAMVGHPHRQKPDLDNFVKGLLDAVFENDAHVWFIKAMKVWANDGFIEIN